MEELASLGLEAKLYLILGRHKRIKWGVGKAKLREPSKNERVWVCVWGVEVEVEVGGLIPFTFMA